MLRLEGEIFQTWVSRLTNSSSTQFAIPTSIGRLPSADHQSVIPMAAAEHDEVASEFANSATILKSLKFFEERVGIILGGPSVIDSDGYREQLSACLDSILENTQGGGLKNTDYGHVSSVDINGLMDFFERML